MKKIIRTIAILLMLTAALPMLTACMGMIRMELPGFAEAMAGFELFDVEVRSVTYLPPPNSLNIALYVDRDALTQETWEQLRDVMDEYMESEQFITFIENHEQDIDLETLSRNTHLFDFGGEHIPYIPRRP